MLTVSTGSAKRATLRLITFTKEHQRPNIVHMVDRAVKKQELPLKNTLFNKKKPRTQNLRLYKWSPLLAGVEVGPRNETWSLFISRTQEALHFHNERADLALCGGAVAMIAVHAYSVLSAHGGNFNFKSRILCTGATLRLRGMAWWRGMHD